MELIMVNMHHNYYLGVEEDFADGHTKVAGRCR